MEPWATCSWVVTLCTVWYFVTAHHVCEERGCCDIWGPRDGAADASSERRGLLDAVPICQQPQQDLETVACANSGRQDVRRDRRNFVGQWITKDRQPQLCLLSDVRHFPKMGSLGDQLVYGNTNTIESTELVTEHQIFLCFSPQLCFRVCLSVESHGGRIPTWC